MDYYNEQLIQKKADGRDWAIRALIGAGTVTVIVLSAMAAVFFGFMPLIIVAFGACYLAYLLFTGTSVEYEYIVTNNDLDIDKISGKRKRKRLITVKLNTVVEWGEYNEGKEHNADATVMAHDGTGIGIWYLIAKHDKYGNVMIMFTPSAETALNINHGVPYGVRKKELKSNEAQEAENDTETEAENE